MYEYPVSRKFKNRKVKPRFLDVEPHETFVDKLAKSQDDELGFSERKFEVPLMKNTLQGLLIFSILLIVILFLKTLHLQVVEGNNFFILAEKNKYILYKIQAERGIIYDKNLKQLVYNIPKFDLVLKRNSFNSSSGDQGRGLIDLANILKTDSRALEKKIAEENGPEILIAENLDHQTLIILEARAEEFTGLEIRQTTARDYRDGEYFSHLMGYLTKINSEEFKEKSAFYSINDCIGRDGIEKTYEDILRKNPGKMRIERDVKGNFISKEMILMPESGDSLVLWLDEDLQKKLRDELEKSIERIGAKGGTAVALDPKTGGVLALVSLPDYNNNLFNKGGNAEELKTLLEDPEKKQSLFNRAISGQYPTGSTIKPLIALAALEENIISPEKIIYASGQIEVVNRYNPEIVYVYPDWKVHGPVDMRKAIAVSCNVYFYTIGGGYGDQEGLGPTRIKKYLDLFGWGEKTGIDLSGEAAGFIPSPEWKESYFTSKSEQVWLDGDTYNLSIGQGFLKATPLEVAASFVPIANGGTFYKPQIVNKIIDSEKNIVKEFQPVVIRENFVDKKNIQIVREGMRQTVTLIEGSAHNTLINLPVTSAAKTGSAQLGRKDPLDNKDYLDSWITVFAPYDDPQIVLSIMVENAKEDQVATLPVAKEVLNWYFSER